MPKIILKKQNWFFEGKEEEEDVVLVLHRHWLILISKVSFIVVSALLPFILLIVLSPFIIKYNLISILSFAWISYYLLLWFWLFYAITMYTLDNWVVTTKRVIDSLQSGFFNRKVSELHLEKIQDVSYKVSGLIPTFFNYGSVEIQTAGKELKFLFEQVPNPQRIKDVIMELILEEEEQENNGGQKGHTHHHVLVEEDGKPEPLVIEGLNTKENISNEDRTENQEVEKII